MSRGGQGQGSPLAGSLQQHGGGGGGGGGGLMLGTGGGGPGGPRSWLARNEWALNPATLAAGSWIPALARHKATASSQSPLRQ